MKHNKRFDFLEGLELDGKDIRVGYSQKYGGNTPNKMGKNKKLD